MIDFVRRLISNMPQCTSYYANLILSCIATRKLVSGQLNNTRQSCDSLPPVFSFAPADHAKFIYFLKFTKEL
jgi:hypothetical protein